MERSRASRPPASAREAKTEKRAVVAHGPAVADAAVGGRRAAVSLGLSPTQASLHKRMITLFPALCAALGLKCGCGVNAKRCRFPPHLPALPPAPHRGMPTIRLPALSEDHVDAAVAAAATDLAALSAPPSDVRVFGDCGRRTEVFLSVPPSGPPPRWATLGVVVSGEPRMRRAVDGSSWRVVAAVIPRAVLNDVRCREGTGLAGEGDVCVFYNTRSELGGQCFVCEGPHNARDCTDPRALLCANCGSADHKYAPNAANCALRHACRHCRSRSHLTPQCPRRATLALSHLLTRTGGTTSFPRLATAQAALSAIADAHSRAARAPARPQRVGGGDGAVRAAVSFAHAAAGDGKRVGPVAPSAAVGPPVAQLRAGSPAALSAAHVGHGSASDTALRSLLARFESPQYLAGVVIAFMREGLSASLANTPAHVDAAQQMIVLVDGLTELDAQARALALRAQIQLPPVTLPVATVGPIASAPTP